jgi:hypothetical protein
MKLRELVDEVIIDPRKLTDYALDLENPKDSHATRTTRYHRATR